jgi:hypothetical protein
MGMKLCHGGSCRSRVESPDLSVWSDFVFITVKEVKRRENVKNERTGNIRCGQASMG